MSNEPRIAKLQALLARIQRHATEPRAAARAPIEVAARPPMLGEPPHAPPPPPPPPPVVEPRVQTKAWESPLDAMIPGIGAAERPRASPRAAAPPVAPPKPPIVHEAPEPAEVEAISGEYAVYQDERSEGPATTVSDETPLELEELGPADVIEENEAVVEIASGAQPVAPAPEEEIAARMESGPAPAPVEEPPESGREIVAAPHESSRMKVAAPLKEERLELEPAVAEPPPQSDRMIAPSARPAPAPIEARPSAPPIPKEAPPKTPIPVAAPPPEPVLEGVAMRAPGVPVEPPAEHAFVALDAVVIRPNVTPKHVAAFVEATRRPMPTTLIALLEDALTL